MRDEDEMKIKDGMTAFILPPSRLILRLSHATIKKSVSFRELRVGIFVLAAIAILVFLILNASGDINPFSKKLHLESTLHGCERFA